MRLAWVTEDESYLRVYDGLLGLRIHFLKPEGTVDSSVDALVVNANGGSGKRSQYAGLRWLQIFRREVRSTVPALIYSFEDLEMLATRFPMLAKGWEGTKFLRLPFTVSKLKRELDSLAVLSDEQLHECIRWYCGLQDEWRQLSHDLGVAVSDWPENRSRAEKILSYWSTSIIANAPDQKPELENLRAALGGRPGVVRAAIQRLEDGLCLNPLTSIESLGHIELPDAPARRPPLGFSTIMIADDQGYELATIDELKRLGYQVADPARNLEEAENLIRYWCPQVVLADLNFPSREEGRRLVQHALNVKCLVIAISRARLKPGDLPAEVEDCCGGLDYQDADRIHRLIWRHALTKGAE
ncbi:MAG: hypothetical protein M3362_01790 [Acidobacteriota bacterium]|nr:hypothetical protein [Acidobacteriota bacterium]